MKFWSAAASVVLIVGSASVSTPANADAQFASLLCDYVAGNNKNRLRKKLKENRIKLRNIYDGVTCSGNNLIRHAIANNADSVGTFMVKKIPSDKLAGYGDVAWAESNGFGGSAVVAAIKDRAGL